MNSPKVMMEGVQSAQSFGADHIILEGSVIGDCGIYSANQVANVLLVDTLMEQIQDASRCIIE